jgi:DNA-binding protein Fis
MKKKRKMVTEPGDGRKDNPVVAVKLQVLKQLIDTIQQEVTALSDYLARDTFSVETGLFDPAHGINLAAETRRLEIDLITYALSCTHGNQRNAARLLGLKPTTLHQKLKLYGISAMHLKQPGSPAQSVTERERKTLSSSPPRIPGGEIYGTVGAGAIKSPPKLAGPVADLSARQVC